MEELKEEKIINKTLQEKIKMNSSEEIDNILSNKNSEDNNKNFNGNDSKNIIEKTEKDNKTETPKDSEPFIDPKKELEKIRLSHMKQYSLFDIIKKSLIFSSKNIKLPLFNIFKKMIK